ncbi:MAG: hypothetical protein RMI91_11075 [Gemmatales bacterium]|nr:hypothetical protein [Gemmatales bacterium]MDW7995185.1 hypothetical protein [Gemmatales bacterium]
MRENLMRRKADPRWNDFVPEPKPTNQNSSAGRFRTWLGLTMVVAVLAVAIWFVYEIVFQGHGLNPFGFWSQHRVPERLVRKHLATCQAECDTALETRLAELRAFLAQRRANCYAFAEEALSLSSKIKLIIYGDGHIKEAFYRHIFSPEELEKRVGHTITGYLQDVANAENKMLVNLHADLNLHLPGAPFSVLTPEQLRRYVEEKMLAMAKEHVWTSLREDVIREVALTVASEILVFALRQLAIRAGIMGTGVASGTITFGVGLALSFILDYLWEKWSDSTRKMAKKLEQELAQLERLIIEGTSESPGLQSVLTKLSQERGKVRELALFSALDQIAKERSP